MYENPFHLCAFFIFSVAVRAQVAFYKVQNGTKTPLKQTDNLVVNLDENMMPDCNLLMEIDQKAFKSAYTYDNILVSAMIKYANGSGNSQYMYISFNFNASANIKKYGSDPYLRFYLFDTKEIKEDVKNMALVNVPVPYEQTKDGYFIKTEGRYLDHTEEYYENGSWKTRDIYTQNELISKFTTPLVTFKLNEKGELDSKYKKLITENNATLDGIRSVGSLDSYAGSEQSSIKNITVNIPMVGSSPAYAALADAIGEIREYKKNLILHETDKQKALDLLEQWNREYLSIEGISADKDLMKTLNKEVKTKKTAEEKLELIKTYNPK